MTQITSRQIKDYAIKNNHIEDNSINKVKIIGLADDASRIQVLSLLASIKDTVLKFTEYEYDVNGKLEYIKVWEDETKVIQLFETHFIYVTGKIFQIVIERIADGFTYTKEFDYYPSGKLKSKHNYI